MHHCDLCSSEILESARAPADGTLAFDVCIICRLGAEEVAEAYLQADLPRRPETVLS